MHPGRRHVYIAALALVAPLSQIVSARVARAQDAGAQHADGDDGKGHARAKGELLRGPHPFLKENALSISVGVAAAAGDAVSGIRAQIAYEYELIGSLWLNVQMAMVDGSDAATDERPCSRCGTAAEVMGGLSYRWRMNIPVIPYAKISGGLLYAFPDQGISAAGLGIRPAAGARYYLFDWLGFGLEVGATLGFVGHDDMSGLSDGVATLDATLGGEWQF